jgi:hypothetical protein
MFSRDILYTILLIGKVSYCLDSAFQNLDNQGRNYHPHIWQEGISTELTAYMSHDALTVDELQSGFTFSSQAKSLIKMHESGLWEFYFRDSQWIRSRDIFNNNSNIPVILIHHTVYQWTVEPSSPPNNSSLTLYAHLHCQRVWLKLDGLTVHIFDRRPGSVRVAYPILELVF